MMGDVSQKIDIESVLRGIGLETVETVDPLHLEEAVSCVKRTNSLPGVKALRLELCRCTSWEGLHELMDRFLPE